MINMPATVTLVPVQGPVGPAGPQGVPGDPGAALAYSYTASQPVTLHQIHHGLAFKPAGIVCIETDGSQLEYDSVTHPMPGVTELTFGVAFAGTVYLS